MRLKRRLLACCSLCAAVVAFSAPVSTARAFESAYTSVDLERDCTIDPATGAADEPASGATWTCPGYDGTDVRVSEGDLRFFLGYGTDADAQCSATQTLSAFNTIGTTLEWRLGRHVSGRPKPIATILRYRTDSDGRTGEYLVVTRLDGSEACHMAYVDVRAGGNANLLAREAADTYAATFDCRQDAAFVYGPDGVSRENLPGSGGACP